MMFRSTRVAVVLLASAVMCWAADPVVGTWTLNPAKSKYNPGPPPRSQTRIYSESADGIKATVKTVNARGQSITVDYPSNYDGKEHNVTGDPEIDGIVMKKVGEYTAESVLMHAGRVIGTARRVIAADGKTMTITFEGETDGQKVNNIGYYEKK